MMKNFSHILKPLSIEMNAYSSIRHSGGTSPSKVQFNFDISVFEGQIDTLDLNK
jgi:hypothetical protein